MFTLTPISRLVPGGAVLALITACNSATAPAPAALPEPLPKHTCTTDLMCRQPGVLPGPCIEAKCVSGICKFRTQWTADCLCVPDTVQTCKLKFGGTGIQSCVNNGGGSKWGACQGVCSG